MPRPTQLNDNIKYIFRTASEETILLVKKEIPQNEWDDLDAFIAELRAEHELTKRKPTSMPKRKPTAKALMILELEKLIRKTNGKYNSRPKRSSI